MQALSPYPTLSFLSVTYASGFSHKATSPWPLSFSNQLCTRHRLSAQPLEQEYVTYDDKKSVFPAEACEEAGGESCEVSGVGPEVKPKPSPIKDSLPSTLAGKDRDYVEYSGDKSVFPGEACDELGGEFCEEEYQKGVFPEKVPPK